jgi:capsular polysaccharide biosynthesis protein
VASWQWMQHDPKVDEVEQGYLSPYKNRRIRPDEKSQFVAHARRVVSGCVYDESGRKLDCSERLGGYGGDHVISVNAAQIDIPSDAVRLPGKTLFLGHHMDHYGHFLTEFISRLWRVFDEQEFDSVVAYPFIFGKSVQPYHRELCRALLGFDLFSKMRIVNGNMLCDQVVIPEPMIHLNRSVHPDVREVYQKISSSMGRPAQRESPYRYFLSRSAQLKNKRIENIGQAEEIFADHGFEVVYPELLDIEQQLMIYSRCKVLAGFSGSALHNVVFCKSGSTLIEVGDLRAPKAFLKMQAMLNSISGARAVKIPFQRGCHPGHVDIEHLEIELSTVLESTDKGD